MKHNWIKKLAVLIAAVMLLGMLTGCATSAGTYTNTYLKQMGRILSGGGSAKAPSGSSAAPAATAATIDAPAEFTVEGSTYSFPAVEGASQYLLCLCESGSTDDSDSYLYSGTIADTGADSYTGEIGDVVNHAYGAYTAKVFALDDNYAMSTGVTADYSVTGELPAPELAYSWDGQGTLKLQVANTEAFDFTATPDSIAVTVSGASGDQSAEIAPGAYTISAVANSTSQFVTNASAAAQTLTLELGEEEQASDNYTEPQQMGGPGGAPGGMGGWEVKPEAVSFEEGAESFAFSIGDMDYFHTTATLQDAPDDGSVYTYQLANGDPNAPFENKMVLQLREDGTANLTVSAAGPIDNADINGTWTVDGGMVNVVW